MRREIALGLALSLAAAISVGAKSSGHDKDHGDDHGRGRSVGHVARSAENEHDRRAPGEQRALRGERARREQRDEARERPSARVYVTERAFPPHGRWESREHLAWLWVHDRPALRRAPRMTVSIGIMVHTVYNRPIVCPEEWTFMQADGYWYARRPGLAPGAWFGVQNAFVLTCANTGPATRAMAVSIISRNGGCILWSGMGEFGPEYVVALRGHEAGPLPCNAPLPEIIDRYARYRDIFVAVTPLAPDAHDGPYYGHEVRGDDYGG